LGGRAGGEGGEEGFSDGSVLRGDLIYFNYYV
jgi:hypothetical protein